MDMGYCGWVMILQILVYKCAQWYTDIGIQVCTVVYRYWYTSVHSGIQILVYKCAQWYTDIGIQVCTVVYRYWYTSVHSGIQILVYKCAQWYTDIGIQVYRKMRPLKISARYLSSRRKV